MTVPLTRFPAACVLLLLALATPAAAQDELAAAGAARVELQRAVAAGDLAAVVALFTTDAQVRSASRVLRGRDSIAAALARIAPGTGRLFFGPEQFENCTDGAIEWGGSWALIRAGADTLRGSYAIQWRRLDGALRIQTLALAGRGASPRVRCPSTRTGAAYRGARFVAAGVFPLFGRSSVGPSIAEEMDRRGYPDRNVDSTTGAENRSNHGKTPVMLSLRARVRPGIWVEAVLSATSYEATSRRMIGNDNWRAVTTSRAHALLAGYEWRTLRLAAGPALVRSSTAMRWRGPNVAGDSTTVATTSAGVAAQAALLYPASQRVAFELRAIAFRVAESSLPAIGGMAAVQGVNHNLAVVSLGLGFMF